MIFISHAWNNGKPDERVLQFVDFLRKHGYEAKCDIMLQQEKTAIHFTEMMADALREAEKILIVLSANYKERADNFQGGVGAEYRYIIDDFTKNENRYVLVSFDGRDASIIPDFLKGRDIVDLSTDVQNEYRELFSKLSGGIKYKFSPVAKTKTVPAVETIENFEFKTTNDLSNKLDISFDFATPLSDIGKKRFIKDSFKKIVESLMGISKEFCRKYPHFQIECDEIDNVTVVFELYRNERKIHALQIWIGSFLGSNEQGICINDSIGSKNSFSEMIVCEEDAGKPVLHFTFGFMSNDKNVNVEDAVKIIWENKFQLYLRRE